MMASGEENLVFGDFEDLGAEESQRIYHILFGQKNQYANKVEFPWNAGAEELQGAVGGVASQSWFCDVGSFEGTPAVSFLGDNCLAEGGPGFPASFSLSDSQGDAGLVDRDDGSSGQKLQGSSKPYERRNKKKRPADYYNRSSVEREDSLENMSGSAFTMTPEPVQQLPVMPTEYKSASMMPPQQQNQVPQMGGVGIHNNLGGGLNRPVQMPVTNASVHSDMNVHRSSVNTAYTINTNSGANTKDYAYQNDDELCEVVVEPCPTNPAKLAARTETYQAQDHDRTSSETYNTPRAGGVEFNHVGVPSVNTNATAIPNSVSDISAGHSAADRHSARVDVSVKDAPVHKFPSQDPSPNQYDSVNVPSPDTGPMVLSEPQTGASSGITFMDVDGSCSSKPNVEVDTFEVNSGVESAPSECGSTSSEASKPKAKSWAALFKGPGGPSVAPVMQQSSGETTEPREVEERQDKECSPLPVPAAEDSNAKQLGEMLSRMGITHSSVALQPRGLINRGNWCYINGTLQALVACPPFYNLLKRLPRYPALSRGPSSTPILDALVEFMHEFQAMPRTEKGERGKKVSKDIAPGAPFEPAYVYKMLQTIAVNPRFKLGKQEDAEEFLSCILDGMHEEMSAVVNHSRPDMEVEASVEDERYTNGFVLHGEEGVDEDTEEEDQWEQVGPKKKSVLTRRSNFAKTPIGDIFAGMLRSAVYKEKAKETATLEPFFTLQLDIQSDKVWSVKEALEGLVSSEPVSGYTCPKTNAEVEVTKKLSLEELPPVLILHLKCFVYNKDGGSQKLMKRVDYPVELEITKELLSPNARNKLREQQRTYKLFAVVYHHGKTVTGGHYTTSVFHPGINGWVHSDDSTVRTLSVGHVLKYQPPRVPYLLYYRRLDSH